MKRKPGIVFLILGVVLLGIGALGQHAFFGVGVAFLAIGVVFLARQRRAEEENKE
jgi:uncharacterized membrane protein